MHVRVLKWLDGLPAREVVDLPKHFDHKIDDLPTQFLTQFGALFRVGPDVEDQVAREEGREPFAAEGGVSDLTHALEALVFEVFDEVLFADGEEIEDTVQKFWGGARIDTVVGVIRSELFAVDPARESAERLR